MHRCVVQESRNVTHDVYEARDTLAFTPYAVHTKSLALKTASLFTLSKIVSRRRLAEQLRTKTTPEKYARYATLRQ